MRGFVPCVGLSHITSPSGQIEVHDYPHVAGEETEALSSWVVELGPESDTTAQSLNDHALLKTAAFLKDKMGNEERQRFSP